MFAEIENIARKLELHINQGNKKYMKVKWKNRSKKNKTGQLKIKSTHWKELKILNI